VNSKGAFLFRTTLIVVFLIAIAFGVLNATLSGGSVDEHDAVQKRPVTTSTSVPSSQYSLGFPNLAGSNMKPGPNLSPGSNPAVLPGDLLIADDDANRILVIDPAGNILWQFPKPGDTKTAAVFKNPDDAFFTQNGQDIIVTEEDYQVISMVNIKTESFVWRYGVPGISGSSPGYVDNPDDAMVLPNNDVVYADIKNCSIVFLNPNRTILKRIGILNHSCYHDPPLRFGSPNGAFPMKDGNYLVTEINGDWADEMTPSGKILWSTHPPGVYYPSDTNEVSNGVYMTADYSNPGQVVEFNQSGQLLWRFGATSGINRMNQPSLCLPIAQNGDVICNDDSNDRVIVIDPKTNSIVWQYGHQQVPGTSPGYLDQPDGIDLAPPNSLLILNKNTMGIP
jgi:outer membrane protein assembly factor BamB